MILYTTSGAATLLLLRFATLLVSDSHRAVIPQYIQWVTMPFVWPLQQIPFLDATLFQDVTIIDVLLIPAVILTGLLIAGVLSGWRESTGPTRPPAVTRR